MLLRARFFGDVREYLKKSWMTMDLLQGSSILDFLMQLSKKNSSLLNKMIEDDDRLGSKITILLNGRNITHLKGLKTELKDRDLISILSVVGGG